jgi:hypothetical protein
MKGFPGWYLFATVQENAMLTDNASPTNAGLEKDEVTCPRDEKIKLNKPDPI